MSAASFCRSCGKALNDQEKAIAGNLQCAVCAPAQASAGSAYQAPPPYYGSQASQPGQPIPGLAFGLGFIPGVGAIYNGQYMKGLVHAVVFGSLVAAADSEAEIFGFLIPVFIFYMAFEAYHTAQRKLRGEAIDEFSSLVPRGGAGFPAGPLVLMGLGVLFLLSNLGLMRFSQFVKFWPLGLIGLGAYLLYERLQVSQPLPESRQIEAAPTAGNGEGSNDTKHAA
jgi:Domain of unknown function (DUF5668)